MKEWRPPIPALAAQHHFLLTLTAMTIDCAPLPIDDNMA
jgi:hypothetical protein